MTPWMKDKMGGREGGEEENEWRLGSLLGGRQLRGFRRDLVSNWLQMSCNFSLVLIFLLAS